MNSEARCSLVAIVKVGLPWRPHRRSGSTRVCRLCLSYLCHVYLHGSVQFQRDVGSVTIVPIEAPESFKPGRRRGC